VIDSGIGITPDQITHLFEKFTVADDSSTSKYGGTGLGLALCQKLCKLMGGEVSVDSEAGSGSRFTIRMPLLTGRRKGDAFAAATLVPSAADAVSQSTADPIDA
jgi:signal transduction histidine kinase